jgi:hypothetical protein
MTVSVIVYQSGQRVERTAWYEAVGVTRPLIPNAPLTVIKLKVGTAFPDWKGRAICWRLHSIEDTSLDNAASIKAGA